ncbi:hypothetical protein SRIMM317S_00553 [Streptomyces rimosus subsp. rimosus]
MTQVATRPRRLPPDEVRALLGEPEPMLENKKIDHIDAFARRFIAHSPFASLATADAAWGRADCSPRGDYPGFVKVLDEHTLAIPDRPGNRIADSFLQHRGEPRGGAALPGARDVGDAAGQRPGRMPPTSPMCWPGCAPRPRRRCWRSSWR